MAKIFISHIAKETDLARLLKKHLAAHLLLDPKDIFVSSDRKSVQAGEDWLKELREALDHAQVEIVLCSQESINRPWINFESGAGWISGKRLIPVCHAGLTVNELPRPLDTLNGLEANQPEGLQYLYEAVAEQLDRQMPPAIDFRALADEIKELEQKYQQQTFERIENPRILCAASEEYAELEFELDVAALEKAFPGKVTSERKLTRNGLIKLLSAARFDILHLVVAVDADNGDLIFSPTLKPSAARPDKLPAAAFASLIVKAQTRLVVLATCNALFLAVEAARVVNTVATNKEPTGPEVAQWAECFYDFLAQGCSLLEAADLTKLSCDIPMRLIPHKDVAFAPKS